ncbi:hypothetical protein FHS38_004168 [Streptomyces netropsis]|uniref:Uncharacterized protein n=1 Tax=Streptomyces netropsis TaxID=55404 RepID=A0A7W7LDA5_STRNE|nr:hypothetical protein [Streptomyces netropsis]GGR32046.1 hypothetical protein GCM10010219_41060 [Streptomyces netropsis]
MPRIGQPFSQLLSISLRKGVDPYLCPAHARTTAVRSRECVPSIASATRRVCSASRSVLSRKRSHFLPISHTVMPSQESPAKPPT